MSRATLWARRQRLSEKYERAAVVRAAGEDVGDREARERAAEATRLGGRGHRAIVAAVAGGRNRAAAGGIGQADVAAVARPPSRPWPARRLALQVCPRRGTRAGAATGRAACVTVVGTMLRVPSLHVVALAALAALAGPGCSIPLVDFQGRLAEDCAVPGDEDGNGLADCDDDACAALAACQPGVCGNGLTERGEQCDDRVETAGCNADCTLARCGDGKLNRAAGEEVDPPMSPSSAVPAATCRFDFTAVSQIYCAGTCGAWGGGNGCQQADADALCGRLRAAGGDCMVLKN